jgi:hypothetical protein
MFMLAIMCFVNLLELKWERIVLLVAFLFSFCHESQCMCKVYTDQSIQVHTDYHIQQYFQIPRRYFNCK